MGYSRSESTLQQMLPYLQPLAEGRTFAWNIANRDGWRFAYKLREALYVALLNREKYPALAQAAERFSIRVMDQGYRVEAVAKRGGPTEATIRAASAGAAVNESPATIHGLGGLQRTDIPTVGLQTCVQVAASWFKQKPIQEPMFFTETSLPGEELKKLWQWARQQTPRLMFFVDATAKTLTLSIAQDDVEEYSWKPAPAPEPVEDLDL